MPYNNRSLQQHTGTQFPKQTCIRDRQHVFRVCEIDLLTLFKTDLKMLPCRKTLLGIFHCVFHLRYCGV